MLRREDGFLSLEWVATIPVMAVLASLLLVSGFVIRDVLVLQEAARVGARVASVTPGTRVAEAAARDAAPEFDDMSVAVIPTRRRAGDPVEVIVHSTRSYGLLSYPVTARSVARTEPVIDAPGGPFNPWRDPTGRYGP